MSGYSSPVPLVSVLLLGDVEALADPSFLVTFVTQASIGLFPFSITVGWYFTTQKENRDAIFRFLRERVSGLKIDLTSL